MAYPANTWRVTFFGGLANGEVWNCGLGAVGAAPTTDDECSTLAQLVLAVFTSETDPPFFPTLAAAQWSAATSLLGARVASYPTGGTTAAHTGEYRLPTPIVGSSGTTHPNQCASVITLTTGASGRSNRGRIYIPATGGDLTSNAQLQAAECASLVSNLAAAMNDWNSSGDNGQFAVISTTRSTSRLITGVRVDSRLDIQRRRANKQAATTTDSATVTTS